MIARQNGTCSVCQSTHTWTCKSEESVRENLKSEFQRPLDHARVHVCGADDAECGREKVRIRILKLGMIEGVVERFFGD
jgi:hypothetical protein